MILLDLGRISQLDRPPEFTRKLDRDLDRFSFERAAAGVTDRHWIERGVTRRASGRADRSGTGEFGRLGWCPYFETIAAKARGRGARFEAEMLGGGDGIIGCQRT